MRNSKKSKNQEIPAFKEINLILKEVGKNQDILSKSQEKLFGNQERLFGSQEKLLGNQERLFKNYEKLSEKQRKEEEKRRKEEEKQRKEAKERERKEEEKEAKAKEKERRDTERTKNFIRAVFARMAVRDRETDRRYNKMRGDLGNDWGSLVEDLVSGSLKKVLKDKDITVDFILKNQNYHSKNVSHRWEFDIIAINGSQIFIFEVKRTMDTDKIDHFMDQLNSFLETSLKDLFPGKQVYAGIAYLDAVKEEALIKYAESLGLLVIHAAGNSARLISSANPKVFYTPC